MKKPKTLPKIKKELQISAKLYSYRETVRKFQKEKYPERIKVYIQLLETVMKANKETPMLAFLRISETSVYQENASAQMMFVAALVEIMEKP